jgi:hypothetical protein
MGDRARRIGLQRLLENFLRLAIPERVLIAHRTIEPPLCDIVARCLKVNGTELLVAAVLRQNRGREKAGLQCEAGYQHAEYARHCQLRSWLQYVRKMSVRP